MGAGGSGASSGGNSSSGGGWGPTMGNGSAYGPGGLGGLGTAGTMSAGAGGSAMSGFGNTAAGGSGHAGISNSSSGYTPPGFTPAYGDPRGLTTPGAPGYVGKNTGLPSGVPSVRSDGVPQGLWHDQKQNTYIAQTRYVHGEPMTTFVKVSNPTTGSSVPAPGSQTVNSAVKGNNLGVSNVQGPPNVPGQPASPGGVSTVNKNNLGINGASSASMGKSGTQGTGGRSGDPR